MHALRVLKNRYVLWSAGIILLAFLCWKASFEGDFKVFLEAAKYLRARQEMYGVWLNHNTAKYYYSPLFALVLVPFSFLPYYVTNFLWLCANVYFLIRIWKITSSKFDLSIFNRKEFRIFLAVTLLLSIRFLLYNFDMVQMTIFLLWIMLQCMRWFENGKVVKGALLLALIINIKLMPVVMIPYLLLRRKFIPVLLVVAFFIIMLFIPAIFIGFHYNKILLCDWLNSINPQNAEHNVDTSYGTQGFTPWLATLLMHTGGEIDIKRNIANLDLSTVNTIIFVVRAIAILFTFYFTGFTFFKAAKSNLRMLWEMSYIILITPMVFPHQQKYEFFLLFPAQLYISYFIVYQAHMDFRFFSRPRWFLATALLFLSFVANTLTSDMFIGMHLSEITQHFKVITYGTMLVAVVLAMCHPRYLETSHVLA